LRVKHSAIAVIVLAVISVICGIVWFVMNKGGEAPLKELAYLLSHIPLTVLAVIFGRYYDKAFFPKEDFVKK
ncbi:MAG: hypothetical protein IKN07_10545, partial [Lachnospiraceae bacterium]|nr:hypothetical protein [Lachnospiraceae bacterium]